VGGALPLQRLAGQDSQPLLRFVAAWLPTGLVAGAVLARVTGLARGARAAIAGLTTFATLFAAGAGSDAVTANERVALHLGPQFRHGAIWLAAAIVAACVFAAAGRVRRPVR
jgi:sulfite exporter TauE/SafE